MGAMFFNGRKGVRKLEYQPNPRTVEMPKKSTLEDLFKKANEMYFKLPDIDCLSLADTNGMHIEIENSIEWKLDQYYTFNRYQPSRHKVYVMHTEKAQVCFELLQ